jgi:hypothetical protein
MLWKTLIKKAYHYCLLNPRFVRPQAIQQLAYAEKKTLYNYLFSMEAKHAEDLRRLLPDVFPKKLQRLPLKITQNIHGAWRVDATDKETVK